MAFLSFVHLALFLALSLSPRNSLVSSWCDHSILASLLWRCLNSSLFTPALLLHTDNRSITAHWIDWQVSAVAVANWPTQQNRAVDGAWRSPVINYSGRASELGCIINLVDRRLSSLSRAERPLSPAKLIARNHVRRLICRGEVRSWKKVSEGNTRHFCWYLNFLKTQCRIGRKKADMRKTISVCTSISIEHRLVTDRQTDSQTKVIYIASTRASIAYRAVKCETQLLFYTPIEYNATQILIYHLVKIWKRREIKSEKSICCNLEHSD